MRIVIILIGIIILSLVVLTLKVSIFEHFDNKKEFKKIVKKLERQYNTKNIKEKCSSEYTACLKNETARSTLIQLFKNYDLGGLMLLKSPKEVVDLRECVMSYYE